MVATIGILIEHFRSSTATKHYGAIFDTKSEQRDSVDVVERYEQNVFTS